jgi:hypothetical protein
MAAPASGGVSSDAEEFPDDDEQAMSRRGRQAASNFRYMTAGFMLC